MKDAVYRELGKAAEWRNVAYKGVDLSQLPKSEENKVCTRSNVMVFFVSLDYHRGLEQWSARHFDLVKVSGSNPLPATKQ